MWNKTQKSFTLGELYIKKTIKKLLHEREILISKLNKMIYRPVETVMKKHNKYLIIQLTLKWYLQILINRLLNRYNN